MRVKSNSRFSRRCRPRNGDKGRRYEVRFHERETGAERVMGWTEMRDGGALLKRAKTLPDASDPFVIDRRTGETVARLRGDIVMSREER